MPLTKTFRPGILFALGLASAILLYFPGLTGPYFFDDLHVIENNRFIRIASLNLESLYLAANSFLEESRELSMLTFALNFYFFGDSTWWMKFVNLCIHGVNGIVLYVLCGKLAGSESNSHSGQASFIRQHLPMVVTVLWLVSPINLIPVLYISQRMALLSAFFIITGMLFYIAVRSKVADSGKRSGYAFAGVILFTYLGYKCKENAILLPLFILLIETAVFRFKTNGKTDRLLVTLYVSGGLLVLSAAAYFLVQNPDWLSRQYSGRVFTLEERTLTQFRVIMVYIFQIVFPSNSHLTLWHDDLLVSKSLFSPISTLFSFFAVATLLIGSFLLRIRFPLVSLGIIWFFIAHALESTILPLELMHEHRNYLASFGVILAIVSISMDALKNRLPLLCVLMLALFVVNAMVLSQRANAWADEYTHAEFEARNRPNSAIAAFEYGKLFYAAAMNGVEGTETVAFQYLSRSARNDPYTAVPELLLATLSEHPNIDYQSEWLRTAAEKLRLYPSMAPSKSALQKYVLCLRAGKCNPPQQDLDVLFDAVLEKSNYNLMTTTAFYYADVEKNQDKAEEIFERALRKNRADTWSNLVGFLINRGKQEQACKVLNEYLDYSSKNTVKRVKYYTARFESYRQQLGGCTT